MPRTIYRWLPRSSGRQNSGVKKYLAAVIRIVLMTVVAIVIYVKLFEHRLIFYPDREMSATPNAPYEDVTLNAADGTQLHAWWLPRPDAKHALIVSHGNAGNISHRTEMGEFLRREFNMNVLTYDYRGYGKSQGSPSEAGTYQDIRAALAYTRQRGFEPHSLFLMGQSLGTAITVDLAAEQAVGGVILEAPFTSVGAVARRLYFSLPLDLLITTKYDSLSKVGRIRAPVAIIHATRDPVIRFEFGRALFEAAREPKTFFQVNADAHEGAMMLLSPDDLGKLRSFLGLR